MAWMPIYEEEMNHWLWQHDKKFKWWLEIRFKAARKPTSCYVGNTNIVADVTYGEWPVTILWLSDHWGCDDSIVSSFLKVMEADGWIKVRKEGMVTIIAVQNFERYCFTMQPEESTANSPPNPMESPLVNPAVSPKAKKRAN